MLSCVTVGGSLSCMTLHLRTHDEYFTSPEPCAALEHVRDFMRSEEGIAEQMRENIRQLQVWDNLGGQIVGAEEPEVMAD